MVRPIVFAAAFAAVVIQAHGEIDFTPKESFYMAEATKVSNVAFRNGKKKMTYSPPGKWTLSGGGRKVTITPPDVPQAGATMQTEPAKAELLPATGENVKAYSDLAVSLLPKEALKVVVVEALVAPIQISRHAMVEVTLTYVHFGQQFTTNILFLPYEKEQITFQMTARTPDFAPLAKMFRSSLFSLQGL